MPEPMVTEPEAEPTTAAFTSVVPEEMATSPETPDVPRVAVAFPEPAVKVPDAPPVPAALLTSVSPDRNETEPELLPAPAAWMSVLPE
jgi:hypothetical protein